MTDLTARVAALLKEITTVGKEIIDRAEPSYSYQQIHFNALVDWHSRLVKASVGLDAALRDLVAEITRLHQENEKVRKQTHTAMRDELDAALTDSLTARVEALLKDITPVDTPKWTLSRYPHGGGALFIDGEAGERTLIADFYNEGDREFYSAAPQLVRDLLAEVARLQSEKRNDTAYRKLHADLVKAHDALVGLPTDSLTHDYATCLIDGILSLREARDAAQAALRDVQAHLIDDLRPWVQHLEDVAGVLASPRAPHTGHDVPVPADLRQTLDVCRQRVQQLSRALATVLSRTQEAYVAAQAHRGAEWQPIATADKDADALLLYLEGSGVYQGYWDGDEWLACETQGLTGGKWHAEPTHWMPLPAPPAPDAAPGSTETP